MVGDGAVGLLAVLAARQLGAERVIAMSRHEPRQKLALDFGATDIVTERGDDGVAKIKDLTGGYGAHSVIEAVGTQESMMQALRSTRPGATSATWACPRASGCPVKNCSSPASSSTAAPPPSGASYPSWSSSYVSAASTPAKSSTSNDLSTRPPRAAGRWTSGRPVVALRAGEDVLAPAGERHWHGAAPDHFMTHLAVSEGDPTWGEHVGDAAYRGEPEH